LYFAEVMHDLYYAKNPITNEHNPIISEHYYNIIKIDCIKAI